VAFTGDEHVDIGASRVLHVLVCAGSARCPNSMRRRWPVSST
jgi:hypothetical protein